MIINLCNDFKCDVTSFVISTSAPSSFSIPPSVFLSLSLSLHASLLGVLDKKPKSLQLIVLYALTFNTLQGVSLV